MGKQSGSVPSRRAFLTQGGAAVVGAALGGGTAVGAGAAEKAGAYDEVLGRVRTPHKHPELVLKPSYEKDAYDALAVDCPFLFRHEGRYWMTHIGFDGVGYRTGLAVSDDLLHWEKLGLLVDRGPQGSVTEFNVALTWIVRDNALFGAGELKAVDGRYLGTYHAYPRPGYEVGPAAIGLCRSDDLRHWTFEKPFLQASDADAGDWGRGGLYKSCLVEHDGIYYMFYNAKTPDAPWAEQTGLVTSPDLRTWQRHDGNPVLRLGPAGAFDDRFCSDPCVVRCDGVWAMFFYTLSSDGRARDSVAFSRDLLTWEKSNEILIDVGPPGSIDSKYAHKPGIFTKDGKLYHFYCAVAPPTSRAMGDVEVNEIRGIAVATS